MHCLTDVAAYASTRTFSLVTLCIDHLDVFSFLFDSVSCLGWFVKETANATHSLTCGVPDRESNETEYLREATGLIKA